jgi:SulP family sulfate permease
MSAIIKALCSWKKKHIPINTTKQDIWAGLVSALIMIPQAVVLATLAGMPPEYGIYASFIPVMVAAFFGSSHQLLSGPNTAISVIIFTSVSAFANPLTPEYIGYVFILTFMVGIIQLLISITKTGAILNYLSSNINSAITIGVAISIVLSQIPLILGSIPIFEDRYWLNAWRGIVGLSDHTFNLFTLIIALVTIFSGMFIRRLFPKVNVLIIGLFSGSLTAWLLTLLLGDTNTNIEYVSHLNMSLMVFSYPHFNLESFIVMKQLMISAIAIAFIGLLQTSIIARSIADKTGQNISIDRENLSQGLANIIASFTSSFAGSGSFNRTMVHYNSGAKTKMAAIYSSLLMMLIVLVFSKYLAYIPLAAMSGSLMIVGLQMFQIKDWKEIFSNYNTAIAFLIVVIASIFSNLQVAVFIGMLLSIVGYLKNTSKPIIHCHTSENINEVIVKVDGSIFFGSVDNLTKKLREIGNEKNWQGKLILDLQDASYIDNDGENAIKIEVERWKKNNGELIVKR